MIEELPKTKESILSPEQQEQVKLAICHFFEGKLTELEIKAGNNSAAYVQQFYELCSGSSRPWTQQKEFDLLGLPTPLRIRFDRHSAYQPELQKMSISVEPLLQAHNATDLRGAALTILESIYHEAEHIFLPVELEEYEGAERGITSMEWIRYASQDTEINAHARQFAFRYSREYPGEPFAIGKMQTLAERLKPQDASAYNYFVAPADPTKQEKYRQVGDLARMHASIVTETENHLRELSRHL